MPVFDDHDSAARVGSDAPSMMESSHPLFPCTRPRQGRIDYGAPLAALPSLGAVLCHVVERPKRAPTSSPCRLWPTHPWLAALPGTRRVQGRVHLDSDGPCEWLECSDVDGVAWMRIVLLPDSDYCAWDRLQRHLSETVAHAELRGCAQRAAWLRGLRGGSHGRVAIVQFHLHVWADQLWLGMDDAPVSRLGRERALERARQWHLGVPRSCRSEPDMR
ncbi:hypothetical protein [Oleiagrimonas soli]|uniref:Hemin transport protein n=2 Tax=Oleiagrimonas soli TaxID=1543381 RepID=A0A841KGL7_9GAMM|nr:hypothetical protein [Oleiagrimonas soli]MBB6184130.1 hypothetical protein [Oleiagrimonas soli]